MKEKKLSGSYSPPYYDLKIQNEKSVNFAGFLLCALFVQSRYAVVSNARFYHQNHLDFVKHLINVYLLKVGPSRFRKFLPK